MNKMRRNNIYEFNNNFNICYSYDKKSFFYFDIEDYDKLKTKYWYPRPDGYFEGSIIGCKKTILVHRFILDVYESSIYVDHINHIRYDNRRSNLRLGNSLLNQQNRITSKNNTSGVKGVSYNKRDNKWEVYINYNYKKIRLGKYKDFDKAVQARKQAEEKYFGEWSYDNSQKLTKIRKEI